ncbi:acetyltransferase [Moritella sp. JT01]|uniref:GNAT family N-acetyltransferase n=1 Tax=Moritella sp. JT01 TaxID=756698 RepID=UPI00079C806E|nr:GNAT family N-acetyltransferase [Moritella sp. JT01]KXO08320.1 acetyltransferase [Moritella sp. JT01]
MQLKVSSSIVLTPLSTSHALELFEAVELSRNNLSQYMPWEKSVIDRESAEDYIDKRLNSGEEGAEWFAINFKNKFGGVFAIKSINRNFSTCELGYWLSDNARGNRVIGQVLENAVPYLANKQNISVIEFHCLESNAASIRIVERVGAKFQSKIANILDVPHKEPSLCIYALEVQA